MDPQWGSARAIETRYRGQRFRSRLEARWAVFFDTLAVRWVYEPEGFDLDGLWYLPDFWLPDLGWWAEIKPELGMGDRFYMPEVHKVMALANHTGRRAFLLEGWFDPLEVDAGGGYVVGMPDWDRYDLGGNWAACLECGDIGITDGGHRHSLACEHGAYGTSPLLAAAYDRARSARFERDGR